ncbi:MAG: hypothetical protein ABSD57_08635 [Verrucomicrobiota bacterium]
MAKPAIFLSARFQAALKNLSDADFARVESALQVIPDCFGHPHAHSGISIRRLRKNIFECRAGLKLRLLFRQNAGALEFFLVGSHDDVRRFLQGF